jgi:hypothetical protein
MHMQLRVREGVSARVHAYIHACTHTSRVHHNSIVHVHIPALCSCSKYLLAEGVRVRVCARAAELHDCLRNLSIFSCTPSPRASNKLRKSSSVTSSSVASPDLSKSSKEILPSLSTSNMSNPSSGWTSVSRRKVAMASTAGAICSGLRSVALLRTSRADTHIESTIFSNCNRCDDRRHSGFAFKAHMAADSRERTSIVSDRSPSPPARPFAWPSTGCAQTPPEGRPAGVLVGGNAEPPCHPSTACESTRLGEFRAQVRAASSRLAWQHRRGSHLSLHSLGWHSDDYA